MAASRVRVLFEFRNGDGNFLRIEGKGPFIACNGEDDAQAIEAAFLSTFQGNKKRVEGLKQLAGKVPHHD